MCLFILITCQSKAKKSYTLHFQRKSMQAGTDDNVEETGT